MENLEFILGALMTIGIIAVGYAVFGVFSIERRSNGFDEAIKDLQIELNSIQRELHLRIDGEINRVDGLNNKSIRYTDEMYKNHEDNINELYRYVDSRFDKFENRIKKEFNDSDKNEKQLLTD